MRKQILIFGHGDGPQFIDIYNQYTSIFDVTHYEVTVVYLTSSDTQQTKNKTLAQHCIFLNDAKKKPSNLKFIEIRKMLALMRQKRFDTVICHRYKPTYIMMWVAKFFYIKTFICIMHEFGTMRSIKRQLAIALLAPKKMMFAGVSQAVCHDIKQNLWWISKKRVVTLYNMMDIDRTLPQLYSRTLARLQFNLSEDDFIFGTLGRLVKNKDHATLIDAFYLIKPHCPHAKLIIMGSGALEEHLKKQVATLGLTHDVIFTGFVHDAFRFIKAFDCFVLSSIQEAFGRVLLEAMVAKVPIIASRVHGIPEVLGKTGCLVTANNKQEFRDAMLHMFSLSSEKKQQWIEAAYQKVVAEFSIPVFQEDFFRVLGVDRHCEERFSRRGNPGNE